MPSTKIQNLSLFCEADIHVKESGTNTYFNYLLHSKPCFGMFFHSPINEDRTTVFEDIDVNVYQFIDPVALTAYHKNNFCSLTPKQLEEFHKELEFVFAKTVKEEESGLKISMEEVLRKCNSALIKTVKIHIEANKLTSYQLLTLLTFTRLSSEYPNAMLLRECCNLQDAGYFKEFSKLSLFMLLCNRHMYSYDQGPLDLFNNRKKMCKPICLEYMQKRMTPGTEEYASTGNRVIKSFLIVDRSLRNQQKFDFPCYSPGGGNSIGEGRLYPTKEIVDKLFNGEVISTHISNFNSLRNMVYAQFPELKVDHPEFKENAKEN